MEHERDTSFWDDIIARAVKSQILPTVKCPVITSGLPHLVVPLYFPAPGFYSDLRSLRRDFADYAASSSLASPRECNGNASDTCFSFSILLARMTRLASLGPKQWSSRVTRSLSFYKVDSPERSGRS